MATNIVPIAQPGVEVVQQIRPEQATPIVPTLPPCMLAPAYEVVELLNPDGSFNTQALYQDSFGRSYENFRARVLAQTEFPGGHVTAPSRGKTNVAAGLVNMNETEIRAFVRYANRVRELAEHDTSNNTRVLKGFLVAHNVATRPYILGDVDLSAGGLNLKDRILFIGVDILGGNFPNYLPTTSSGRDISVVFSSGTEPGGTLSAQDVVDQINGVFADLAMLVEREVTSVVAAGGAGSFTPGERVTGGTSGAYGTFLRESGGRVYLEDVPDAATFAALETLTGSVSSATRAVDAAPNQLSADEQRLALISPSYGAKARIILRDTGTANDKLGFQLPNQNGDVYALGAGFRGRDDGNGDLTTSLIELFRGAEKTLNAVQAGAVDFINGAYVFRKQAHPITDLDFTRSSGSSIRREDEMWADGVRVGLMYAAENKLLTLGDFDLSRSLQKREINIPTHPSAPFAPRYVYFVARNLGATPELGATRASVTGYVDPWTDEQPAYVRSSDSPTLDYTGGGAVFKYLVTVDGVDSVERTHVLENPTIPFADVDELVTALNTGVSANGTCNPPLGDFGEIFAEKIIVAGAEFVGFKTGVSIGNQKKGPLQSLLFLPSAGLALLDPGADPNIVDGERYVGLSAHSKDNFRGNDSNAHSERALVSTVDFVPVPKFTRFVLTVYEDNRPGVEYVLEMDGDFSSAGSPFSDATLRASYNIAAELNGQYQGSAGEITVISVDGVAQPTGTRLRDVPELVRWEFLGANKLIQITATGGGPLVVGEPVTQATSNATGVVVSAAGLGAVIEVTGGQFNLTDTITGDYSAVALTGPHTPSARLGLLCAQKGASNAVLLEDYDGSNQLVGTIGFATGGNNAIVRGQGVRSGSRFYFRLDQNPANLSIVVQEKNIVWETKDGVNAVLLPDVVESINLASQQDTASIVTASSQHQLRLVSEKYGLPSEVLVDPQGEGAGNAGMVELLDPVGIIATVSEVELGRSFDEIVAKTETGGSPAREGRGFLSRGLGRPLPDFAVLSSDPAEVWIGSQIIRNVTTGYPIGAVSGELYISYRGLREDISPLQRDNGAQVLSFSNEEDLQDAMGDLTTKNPLGLMLRMGLNTVGEGTPVYGIGVPYVSDAEPDGTQVGYQIALDFIEAARVYSLCPLSRDTRVHLLVHDHVQRMSEPRAKADRVAYLATGFPKYDVPTLLGAGVDGNYAGLSGQFQIEDNLALAMQAEGAVGDLNNILFADHIYLEIAGLAQRWSISAAALAGQGMILQTRTSFTSGQNDDGFYTTDALPSLLVNADWKVLKRGAALTTNTLLSEAIAKQGQQFSDRRIRHLVLNELFVNFAGVEEQVSPSYITAVFGGLAAILPPQQSFTNYELPSFLTKVRGTNDKFTSTQLDLIAGGGNNILIQLEANGPLLSRMQLTTDVTSPETQEDSITRILDFVAYFLRDSIRPLIGKSNITNSFLDALSILIDGMVQFLVEQNVLISAELTDLSRDPADKRGILVELVLEVPFPCNKIKIVLAI